jgi:hypothetical protein
MPLDQFGDSLTVDGGAVSASERSEIHSASTTGLSRRHVCKTTRDGSLFLLSIGSTVSRSCQLRAEQQTIGTGSVAAYPGGPWGFGQPQGPGGAWPILGLTAAQREQIQSFVTAIGKKWLLSEVFREHTASCSRDFGRPL